MKNGETEKLVYLPWQEDLDAVWYQVKIYPLYQERKHWIEGKAIYKNRKVFRSGVIFPASILEQYKNDEDMYWSVCPINANGVISGPYSEGRKLSETMVLLERVAPIRRPKSSTKGLLYPTYSFLRIPNAVSYEVAVYDHRPTTDDELPIWSDMTSLPTVFDHEPRFESVYWRVRGLDVSGNPVGTWSMTYQTIGVDASCDVGILGDSISHGGGLMAYAPTDKEYNYMSYLSFPVMNMARSGDTSDDLANRFDRDTKIFKGKYLLIMGGTNDLRLGLSAKHVIRNMERIKEKCDNRGIIPVFLTILPTNPATIEEFYGMTTVGEEAEKEREILNRWIRSELHIDTASLFEGNGPLLPIWSVDGLHPDRKAKEKMGRYIDKEFLRIKADKNK